MVDIHAHVLPNIDDGAKNINETLEILKQAYDSGFTDIICTSHYMSESYNLDKKQRLILIDELKPKLAENNININLHVGAEAYISIDLDELIKQEIVPTLNNTKYLLMEVPMNSKILYLDDMIDKFMSMNIVPIMAHPERYSFVQEDINVIPKLIDKGFLFQANYASICGFYGKTAEKTVKKLLKNNMIHFLASDEHHSNNIYVKMDTYKKKIRKYIKEDQFELLTQINPRKVLNNENI